MDLICLFIAHLFISGVVSTTFTVTNKCDYTICPGILSNEDDPPLFTTGCSLQKGQSKTIAAPTSWGGRLRGRTHCTEDSTGKFSCITGDCGSGKVECLGNGVAPPATLAEFKLDGSGRLDFFYVSLFDGLNLPLLFVPSDRNCISVGWLVDLNGECSSQLKVTSSNGEIVACKGESQAFGSPQYCASADYQIIFCAAKNSSPRRRLASEYITGNPKNSPPPVTANDTENSSAPVVIYKHATADVTVTAPSPKRPEEITPGPSPRTNTTTVYTTSYSPPPSDRSSFIPGLGPQNETGETSPRWPEEITPSPSPSPRGTEEITPSPSPRTSTATDNSPPTSGEIAPSPLPEDNKPSPLPSNNPSRQRLAPTTARIIGGALFIISLVVVIIIRARRWMKTKKSKEDVEDNQINQVPGMPVKFSYEDLRIATDDFKETLGKGGSGSVFKGVLADGTGIAVKLLDRLGHGKRAFLAEVETIGSLHHFNLVRLIGFCAEKSYTLLVYEYLSNGSLDNWIFKKNQRSSLDWQTRKKIILDIAKGLAYLHEDCRQTIMHLDIKPQNILLDQNFNAKISDFGLSKLIDRDMGQVQISMRGTPGYLAPEWCQPLGRITVKVDIYSFGIVLLEVVCARKCTDDSQPESAFHLLRMLQKEAVYVVDHLEAYMQSDREEIIRMIKIAAWCLQDDPESRPLMSTVVKVLEGVMEVDSNLMYKFSHALTSSPVVNQHICSAPPSASVLSYPR